MNSVITYIFRQVKENKLSAKEAKKLLQEISEARKKRETSLERDIAIIGMAGRLPRANNLVEFWDNLSQGIDCIEQIPELRKIELEKMIAAFYGNDLGEVTYNQAAYLERIDLFDPFFFNIPPVEAKLMSPEQRIFLEVAWEALEDAGYSEDELNGSQTGVYAGFSQSDYTKIIRGYAPSAVSGNLPSVTAARLAYTFNLLGPCPVIDTACSSSLVALHLACQGLRAGDCQMAVVGGVRLFLFPLKDYTFNQLGIESPDGKCKTFDIGADGIGGGEGAGVIVLKTLSQAKKDRDQIYAVIKGSAINNDGRSNGIAAPNALAQTRVICEAWERSGIAPETISYIEAHGTGTKLGDPIEIEGLSKAFQRYTEKKNFCPIGSLKTNLGHLDSAAGIVSVIKTVLAMKHGQIPPTLHFKEPNSFVNFLESPLYVNNYLEPWATSSNPLRAGISSFGISGTNCHLVIEEAPGVQEIEEELPKAYLFTLSAKTETAFWALLEKYNQFLQKQQPCLGDLCFTSNIGRGQYRFRLAILAKELAVLKSQLTWLSENGQEPNWQTLAESEMIFFSQIKSKNQVPRMIKVSKDADLGLIARQFIAGNKLNWQNFYQNQKVSRISLPTYPFDHAAYWVDYYPQESGNHIFQQIQRLGYRLADVDIPEAKDNSFAGELSRANYTLEEVLCQIWSDVLGYEQISQDDDFFELGGNSLTALQVIAAIEKSLQQKLPLQLFMEKSTIKELSKHLQRIEKKQEVKILQQPLREYYPVSSSQKQMYLLQKHSPKETVYNMPGAMTILGKLDEERFSQVFQKLVQRHEAFRTAFLMIDGQLVQKIYYEHLPESFLELEVSEDVNYDLRIALADFVRPFDLAKPPLLRIKLVKLSKDKYIFLYDMHHIISDGLSMMILFEEFSKLYSGLELPLLRLQYKDFVVWQIERTKRAEKRLWLEKFSGELPVLNLPTDFSRSEVKDHRGASLTFELDSTLRKKVYEIVKRESVTLFVFLLAAYSILLAKYSNQEDIIIGSPLAGRSQPDLENVIGMFVKTIALRVFPAQQMTFLEYLHEVKETAFFAFENQEFQLEMLIEELNLEAKAGRNLLFDTIFTVQNFQQKTNLRFADIELYPLAIELETAKLDLTLTTWELETGIHFEFAYLVGLFTEETISKMGQDLISILQQIVADTQLKLNQIKLATKLKVAKPQLNDQGDFDFLGLGGVKN